MPLQSRQANPRQANPRSDPYPASFYDLTHSTARPTARPVSSPRSRAWRVRAGAYRGSSGVETLRSDPQIAAGPADGAYLMAIPHRRNGGRSRRVNNTPNKGLPELVDKEVARRRTTRSAGCPEGLTLAKQPSLLKLWHCFAFHFSNEKRNGTLRLRRSGACKALANWPCASWA